MTKPASTVRFRAVVAGRVQGVGFRIACARVAQGLGLAGWVANARDGSVLIEAQGPAEAVERLMGWLHVGPIGARVTAVDVNWTEPDLAAVSFEIRSLRSR